MNTKSKAQELLEQAIEALEPGESITLGPKFTGTQWSYTFSRASATRVDAMIANVDEATGMHLFCDVTTVGHPYGLPMIVEEPSLGVPCRDCGIEAEGAIVGAIVLNDDHDVTRRTSWSKIVKAERGTFAISADGEFFVNGVSEGFISQLITVNKNRVRGWIAIVVPTRPAQPVLTLEVQSLAELAAKRGLLN